MIGRLAPYKKNILGLLKTPILQSRLHFRFCTKIAPTDLLEDTISLDDIKEKELKKIDSARFSNMVRIEEGVDLPFQLHGIQSKPSQNVVAFDYLS